jgi:hypothetical protein
MIANPSIGSSDFGRRAAALLNSRVKMRESLSARHPRRRSFPPRHHKSSNELRDHAGTPLAALAKARQSDGALCILQRRRVHLTEGAVRSEGGARSRARKPAAADGRAG